MATASPELDQVIVSAWVLIRFLWTAPALVFATLVSVITWIFIDFRQQLRQLADGTENLRAEVRKDIENLRVEVTEVREQLRRTANAMEKMREDISGQYKELREYVFRRGGNREQ
jgi:hypothetical protein